ncbi:YbhB/YbcL family Raf kinase inhibitor-like protein [Saccharopolyspora sp. CA-218241]|uniref:YbhB/YbcL family Raf kinase inhibitor-like protein n=1 Tax=Saccharopolyspora sp. CA-218241 TaxID=3240027 RepID=UPI003D9671B1
MPRPGSHKYEIKRAHRRTGYERQEGMPDQRAKEKADYDLHQQNPPMRPADDRAAGPFGERPSGRPGAKGRQHDAEGGGIRLRSSSFQDHDLMPRWCSGDGEGVSPELEWDGVPDGTVELAVVCVDPDAPTGTFVHWLLTGLRPGESGLEPGRLPDGAVESRNDFGEPGWGGPLPPAGDDPHRYFFRVHASDHPLRLGEDSTVDDLDRALGGGELARGTLVGVYQR